MGAELNKLLQKYNLNTANMASTLGAMGRGNDSLVAHITPEEAMLLKQRGGAGTINPRTGLLEFYDGGDGGGDGGDGGGDGAGGDEGGGSSEDGAAAEAAAAQAEAAAQAMADVDAAIAAGFGPEAPDYGYSIDTSQMDSAIAQGLGPESPGYGNLGFDVSDPSNAIAVGYGPESYGYSSPVTDYGGGGGGGGYNDGSGGNGGDTGGVYIPPVVTNPPVVTAPPVVTTPPTATQPSTTAPTTTAPTTAPAATSGTFQFAAPTSPAFYGFELNRLMQQYGVPAPTIIPYGGAAAQADAAKAAYDQKIYQNYVNEYQNRLANTNMYNRAQFMPNPTAFRPQYTAPVATPTYAPANYGGIANVYSKYFGREPEQAGVEYWGKTGLTGDQLSKAITSGAQNADLEYLRKNYPNMGYARGGRVGYAEGGEADPPVETGAFPGPSADEGSFVSQPMTVSPAAPAPATSTAPSRSQMLGELLSRYAAPSGESTRELAAARQAARTETEAFSNMIRQMAERGESPTSRAEMYFRLASAFGSPTKTGQFTENLALAGREMGEVAKGRRAEEAERRGLLLKAQELKMSGARQDLATAQTLAAQESAERRALAKEVIKEYIASGRPQSDAGKMAQDAGLVPGTQEYNQFVNRYIQNKMESGELYRQAMLEISRQGLELRRMAEARQEESGKQLSPTELKLRESTEDELSGVNQAIRGLTRALAINERAFGNSLVEAAQYQALRTAGIENEKVVNTTELRNILGRAAISNLKATFGGAPTEGERAALMELEGALSKTPAERRRIIENSLAELRRSAETRRRRLDDIVSGRYRQRTETTPGSSGDNQ